MGILSNVWPGWGTGSAKMLCYLANIPTENWRVIGIVLMLVILAINLGGPIIYNMIEKVELVLVVIALILVVIAVFATGSVHAVGSLWAESITHFGFFSTTTKAGTEVAMLSLLGGLAYAGAGGTINSLQSVWTREKGYAMGAYQGRVENPIRVPAEEIEPVYPAGFVFDPSDELQVARWKAWWKVINLEHFITFCLPLLITTMITCAIAVSFVQRGLVPPPAAGAIDMWIDPQNGILPAMSSLGQAWIAWGIALIIWIALFTTQLAIVDVVVRFTSDALYDLWLRSKPNWHPGKVFFVILLLEVFGAIAIIAANVGKPWFLLVLGAGLNGYTMWYYNMFLTYYNTARLPSYLQPSWWRIICMWGAILFFGFLSVIALEQSIFGIPAEKYFVIGGENPVGTVLWAIYVILFIFVAALSVKYKLNPIDRRAEKAE